MALASLAGNELVLTDLVHDLFTVDSILDALDCANPIGIAIDAPLVIPNDSGQRLCEKLIGREYSARKVSCHTSNQSLYPNADSVSLSRALESRGYGHLAGSDRQWQLECYPHPALIEIFGLPERHKYKKGRVGEKKTGQVALASRLLSLETSTVLTLKVPKRLRKCFEAEHIHGLVGSALKRNEDALDAVVCVYIAGLYASGLTDQVFGTQADGYIYVPRRRCM